MPHSSPADPPSRAAIFERDGSIVAVVMISGLLVMLVVVAAYSLLRSQSSAKAYQPKVSSTVPNSSPPRATAQARPLIERQSR